MHSAFYQLARFMAALGGLILTALMLMTSLSVLLRALGFGPVPGDFELVEAGIAFAIFAFLPWCQMNAGHATVDLFVPLFPRVVNRWILAFWEVVFAAVLVLIAARLYEGMLGKMNNGETTFLLQFPVWWSYAASVCGAVVAAVVSVYVALRRVMGALGGQDTLPAGGGAGH
ncbi:TRAP transporter small permease [Fertoebacter nigrum]|uniref:TRAP transporter small permease protein n=1 Tax=Fertoeibacter niger TaxID=2656921 RepID=A0A8X8H1G2_9RHOB|nr:TRAP transporter small permease [Fertoeibacter niger]NUB45838.1 TRAP transporter small permease [Fertoeibacter niger]